MVKTRQESIATYEKTNATDRVEAEKAEVDIIQQWLPVTADAVQTRSWVLEVLKRHGAADSPPHAGKVMGELMKEHKSVLDGKLAKTIVQDEIAKLNK